jgi:hypothetical protein
MPIRHHSNEWPLDTENQAQCAGKLTGGQKRKILQWHACDFVDDVHNMRIAAHLSEAEKRDTEGTQTGLSACLRPYPFVAKPDRSIRIGLALCQLEVALRELAREAGDAIP